MAELGGGQVEMLENTREYNKMHTNVHARLMVTRGTKKKPFQHPKLSIYGPTIVIIMEHSTPASSLEKGIKLATVPQVRGLPMSQDPKLNSHSKLNCVCKLFSTYNFSLYKACPERLKIPS